MKKISLTTLFTLLSNPSFAFFCPTNFNQIEAGFSIQQVIALCGEPSKKEEKEIEAPAPQEWTYYVPQTVAANSLQSVQGTLKVSFSFDKEGKVLNISVNGIGVGATDICGGPNLKLGDSPDMVKAACGEPTFINKQEPTGSEKQRPTKMTTLIYDTPSAKLIFKNGSLEKQE